jgi:hypothetical protein
MEGFSNWAKEGILPNKPKLIQVNSNTTTRNPIRNTFQNILTARVIVGNFVNRNWGTGYYDLQKSCFKADKSTDGYESILNNFLLPAF